jgi:hypothetical protein
MLWFQLLACVEESSQKSENVEDVQDSSEEFQESLNLDLNDAKDNVTAFVKSRGSLNEDDIVVFYFKGFVYNHVDIPPEVEGETSYFNDALFQFEGFNIAKVIKYSEYEYQFLSREITLYKDNTGRVLNCFNNRDIVGTENAEFVPVVHVQNDPVNYYLYGSDYRDVGPEMISWVQEMFLSYPSPLPMNEYPEFSAGNTYQSIEIFDFFTNVDDINNPNLDSVPVHLSWVRQGQYLPWMRAGQTDGKLVYHGQGYKLMDGYDGLPEDLKEWVQDNAPEYTEPPSYDVGKNVTSWRYMESLLEEDTYSYDCE